MTFLTTLATITGCLGLALALGGVVATAITAWTVGKALNEADHEEALP